MGPASARRRSRTPGRWWPLLRPEKVPSLRRREGSWAAWCSCLKVFWVSRRTLAGPPARRRTAEPRRRGFPSPLKNTSREASMRPSSMRHRPLKNSSPSSAPLVLFFGSPREAPERTTDGSLAHPNPAGGEEELGPLGVGGPRPSFEIFYEEPPRLLVQLRFLARSLPGLQSAALV
jgi:hypothetical protein